MIAIHVPGKPIAKGRPRAAIRGGHVRMFTPERTVAYEALIALAGQDVMGPLEPLEGAVTLAIVATFAIPKSWSKAKKADAVAGKVWHTSRPDGDNILKAVGDGLNGVVWRDDSQIAHCSISKRYGARPGLEIVVRTP